MRILTVFIFTIYFFAGQSQPPANRYIAPLFNTVTETTNVLFSSNVPVPQPGGGFYETLTGYPLNVDEFSTTNVNLYMNIFQPTGDTLSKRPVVIVCFGGGFITGSKDHWSIRLLAQELAKRGFVTAVIDYRLGMNIFDGDLSMRAVYRGVQDGRSAVRFFKANAAGSNTYKIDPDQIYIGGHSAGAFVATHNAYLDKEAERPAPTYTWPQGCGFFDLSTCWCPDQGCLDCAGNNQSYSGHAKAVFSLAGAVGFTSYMETSTDPKIVMFHSQDDDTVPYDQGQPFSSVSGWIVGFDLPDVFGSLPMSQRADIINIPDQFYSYTNRGHGVHEATSSTLYTDIVPNIAEYFNSQLLKPVAHTISGKTSVCNSLPVQTYSTVPSLTKYYHWEVTGGSFVSYNPSLPTVTVTWDINAPSHILKLTPYSKWDSKGDQTVLNVNVSPSFQNTWTAGTGSWTNTGFWSLGYIPEACHHVIIPNQTTPQEITFPASTTAQIKSLFVGSKAKLVIKNPSNLIVEN
ncbi:MAG: alpha/beta hydrolase [Saprospiraceae bacterium]|nr:alpha/beta hydrolase [Saprospiraceae bacterium]